MLYGQWIWSRVANARQLRVPARGFGDCLVGYGDLGTTNARIFWFFGGWRLINFKIEARVQTHQPEPIPQRLLKRV